jgi:hypothetical protein
MEVSLQTCENCKHSFEQSKSSCPSCGFPVTGSEAQKERFYHEIEANKLHLKKLQDEIFYARVSLWIIALSSFLSSLLYYFFHSDAPDALFILIVNTLVSAIFMLLGFYAAERPFSALIAGLVIYGSLIVYRLIDQQNDMYFGIILKIAIVLYLIKGISSTREAEDLKKEIDKRSK